MPISDFPDEQNATLHDWSDAELAVAVDSYMAMLRDELAGRPYVKSEVNRMLRDTALHARTKASIEFRMQNISATLFDLRMPRIRGYLPAKNVGSNVKERIRAVLSKLDLRDLEVYIPTADPSALAKKVRTLRGQPLGDVPLGSAKPSHVVATSITYVRDPAVKRWVLVEANGICEGCDNPAPFLDTDGFPYLEVHHVTQLANHGSDRTSNAVALCPNCHRRCHSAKDRDEFKISLYQKIKRLKIEVPEPYDQEMSELIDPE
ncbi:MAG TPA: HNH endonuclease signature motif containing protein [Telluria sp.]|nr:HNH endonuclease signature motif containing protein [Telluria sp.]